MRGFDGWIAADVFHMNTAVFARGFGGNTDAPLVRSTLGSPGLSKVLYLILFNQIS
jgi:hypothetical protein